MLNDRVLSAIAEYDMLRENDNIVIGVSGGADSVALLDFLYNMPLELNITVAHVNHLLRGDMSFRDEEFVEKLCEKYKLPLRVSRVDIRKTASERNIGLEECGRQIRYEFFNSVASELNSKIATAHTLSDKTETMLFNIIRGSSLRGLYSIPAVRGNIIRPLIKCSRKDVEEYCGEKNLEFVTDYSNLTTDYTRNKIRLEIMPLIYEINPSFLKSAERLMENIKIDGDFLNLIAEEKFEKAFEKNELCLSELLCLEDNILRRVIYIFLKKNGLAVGYDKIIRISEIIRNKNGKINISKGIYIIAENNGLFCAENNDFENNMKLPYFEEVLFDKSKIEDNIYEYNRNNTVNITSINGYLIKILFKSRENYKINDIEDKKILILRMSYDKIVGMVGIRQKIDGDKINIFGRNGTKSLKKLFNEAKYDAVQKSAVPVFVDEVGVIAVPGFGVDKRVAVDDNIGEDGNQIIMEIEKIDE